MRFPVANSCRAPRARTPGAGAACASVAWFISASRFGTSAPEGERPAHAHALPAGDAAGKGDRYRVALDTLGPQRKLQPIAPGSGDPELGADGERLRAPPGAPRAAEHRGGPRLERGLEQGEQAREIDRSARIAASGG